MLTKIFLKSIKFQKNIRKKGIIGPIELGDGYVAKEKLPDDLEIMSPKLLEMMRDHHSLYKWMIRVTRFH